MASVDSPMISVQPPERISQDYPKLRQTGVALIGKYAKATWTDHNIHDPGITFLEAFCYALTDIGFRNRLDMADLLRSGEAYAPQDLPPVHRVLPCAPVTAEDLRKILLDHYLIKDAAITATDRNTIAFFMDPSALPPISYTVTGPRIPLGGLYEARIEFNNTQLNSNSYLVTISVGSENFQLDIALPHWDEVESMPFRQSVALTTITIQSGPSGIWRSLEEEQTYFARLQVDFTDAGGANSQQLWLVARIVDTLADPVVQAPPILAAAQVLIQTVAVDSLIDLYRQRVAAAFQGVSKVARYLESWRNLAQTHTTISVVREQEIAVNALIEVNNGIDLEQLVARIFFAIEQFLSPPGQLATLSDLIAADQESRAIYQGPLLQHGFLNQDDPDNHESITEIFTSDILRIIMQQRGGQTTGDLLQQESIQGRDILAVSNLTLSNFVNNRRIAKAARDCLRLVEVDRYRPRLSLAKSRLILVRDSIEIAYDIVRVDELFGQLLDALSAETIDEAPTMLWPVAEGEALAIDDYYPYQNELPRIYAVGEARLPKNASTERKAQALQTKGYLLMSEQFLADATAMFAHINQFFSPHADQPHSYFTKPLFDLAGVDKLIKSFSPTDDWDAFTHDPNNPYSIALRDAIEDEPTFVDRRNRMLDHLLARQGMDLFAWSRELHRYAYQQLKDSGLDASQLQASLESQRLDINRELIRHKAALLTHSPYLNETRFQAYANPARSQTQLIELVELDTCWSWQLQISGSAMIGAVAPVTTRAEAYMLAEEALLLATQSQNYSVVSLSGRRHFLLREGVEPGDREMGLSVQSWTTVAAAQNAINRSVASFLDIRIRHSLTSFERLVSHHCGIEHEIRRRLMTALDSFFEIYDEVDSDGIIEKRWRLWSQPGYSGQVLLSSNYHFVAPPGVVDPLAQEAMATDLARESIDQAIALGIQPWNYRISPAGPLTYNFDLYTPTMDKAAGYIPPLLSEAEAQARIFQTVEFLRQLFSREGFHCVEHLLIRPQQNTETFLAIPLDPIEQLSDPYSNRLSLVFPSGYARDFSLDPTNAVMTPVSPHRFRDREFRKYVKRVVEQFCPAHLQADIYWVDQQLAGNPQHKASFDSFETRYFAWLEGILVPGSSASTQLGQRTALVSSLNAIINA